MVHGPMDFPSDDPRRGARTPPEARHQMNAWGANRCLGRLIYRSATTRSVRPGLTRIAMDHVPFQAPESRSAYVLPTTDNASGARVNRGDRRSGRNARLGRALGVSVRCSSPARRDVRVGNSRIGGRYVRCVLHPGAPCECTRSRACFSRGVNSRRAVQEALTDR